MTTRKTFMKTFTKTLLLGAWLAGCSGTTLPRYDEQASQEFFALWSKRQAGDDKGWDEGLRALAKKYPGTRVADRCNALLATPTPNPTPNPNPTPTPNPTQVPNPIQTPTPEPTPEPVKAPEPVPT